MGPYNSSPLETSHYKKVCYGEMQDAFVNRLHKEEYAKQLKMSNPIVYMTIPQQNKDTMYFHQAMQQDDSHKFVDVILKEVNAHIQNEHWLLINTKDVPKGTTVIPAV